MRKGSPRNPKRFCHNVVSSLPGSLVVYESYFIDVNPTQPDKKFDYKLFVVTGFPRDVSFALYPISDAKELSFLECMLLREVIGHVETSESFVLGVRFGPEVNRGANGRIFSDLEVLSLKDTEFMHDLLTVLKVCSSVPHLFDDTVDLIEFVDDKEGFTIPFVPPWGIPGFLQTYMKDLCKGEALEETRCQGLLDLFDQYTRYIIGHVGLGRLLVIPELDSKDRRKKLPLTEVDASRINLVQDVMKPRYDTRIAMRLPYVVETTMTNPDWIKVDWARIPARLFVYGPILDLINAFRGKRMVKVCENCGKFYRPHQTEHHRKIQRYCSSVCRKRAESKRLYQT